MPLPVVQKDQALSQAHASLKAPLEAVEEGGGGFPRARRLAACRFWRRKAAEARASCQGSVKVAFSQVVRAQESPAMRAGGTPRAS